MEERKYSDKWFFYNKADDLYSEKKYWDAIDNFRKAIKLDKHFNDALHMLGVCYERLDRYDEAFEYYRKNIEIDPEYGFSLYGAGNMMFRSKKYFQAISFFEKCIAIESDLGITFDSLGLTLEKLGRIGESRQYLKKAIELEPEREDFKTHYKLVGNYKDNSIKLHKEGHRFFRVKQYKDSLRQFEQATMINPNDIEAWHMRGVQHEFLRNYTEAYENYRYAAGIDPEYSLSWLGMGNMHLIFGEYEKALSQYKTALKLDPELIAAKEAMELTSSIMDSEKINLFICGSFEFLDTLEIEEFVMNLKNTNLFNKIIHEFSNDDEERLDFLERNIRDFHTCMIFCDDPSIEEEFKDDFLALKNAKKRIICVYEIAERIPEYISDVISLKFNEEKVEEFFNKLVRILFSDE